MRRPRASAALALALLAALAALPARAGADDALEDYKAGRYLEAAAEIQAVIDRSPGYAYGHFLLGHCMLKMRRTRDAEVEFRRALSLDSTRAEYFQGFALALSAAGKWPFTIRAASDGLARTTAPRTRYELLALRGYAWGALRRWSDAVGDLEAAERIHKEPWVFLLLGKARFAMGAWADAIPPLREAMKAVPDEPAVLRLLAESFLRLAGDDDDAVRKRFAYTQSLAYAQRLASVVPDDLDAVHLVGRAALGAGRLGQAETVFRHVLAVNPRQCYAIANLGRTYMAQARWSEAETYLRQASACAPRLTTIYESLGDLYLELGRPQDAAAAFRRIEEIEPTHAEGEIPATTPVFQSR